MTPNNMPQLDLEKRIKNMLAMDFNLENAGGSKRISLAQLDGITIIPDLNNPDTYLLLDKRKGNKELAKVKVDSNRLVRFPSATDKEKAFTYMGFALKNAELAMNNKGITGQVSAKTSSKQDSSSSELSSSDKLEKRASEKLTEQELATWRRYNEAKKNPNYKEQYNPEIHNIIQKLYSAEENALKQQAVEEVKRGNQSQSTSKSSILEARENGEIKIPDNYPAPITVKKNDGFSKKTVTTYNPPKPIQGYAPLDIEMDYSDGKMQIIINGQNIQLKPGVTTYITVDPQGKVLSVSTEKDIELGQPLKPSRQQEGSSQGITNPRPNSGFTPSTKPTTAGQQQKDTSLNGLPQQSAVQNPNTLPGNLKHTPAHHTHKTLAQHKHPKNPSGETQDAIFELSRIQANSWLASLESKIMKLESNVKQKTPITPSLIQDILYDHAQLKQRIEDSKIALANAKQLMTENKHLFDAAKEEYKTELITYTKKKEELIPVLEEQAHILKNFLKSKFGLDLAEKHSSIEAINNTIKDVEKLQDQKRENITQRENKHAAARSKLIENENLLMKEFYANPREINKNFLEYAKSMGSKAMNAQKPLDEQQKEVGMLYSVTEKYIKSLQKTVAANRQILQENPDLIHSDPYVMRAKKRAILAEKHLNRALEEVNKVAGRLEKKFGFKISDSINIQGNSKPHEQSQTSVSQSNINSATQDLHTPSSPSTVNPNKLADIKNDKEGKNKLNGIMNSFKKHVVGTRFRSGPKAASTPLPKGKGVNLRNSQDKGKSKM